MTLYATAYLSVPVLLAAAWTAGLGGPWVPELLVFSLFGVALALTLVALALGRPRAPALLFLAAGLLVVAGAPVTPLLTLLVVAVLIQLLALTGEVPRYAVHLL